METQCYTTSCYSQSFIDNSWITAGDVFGITAFTASGKGTVALGEVGDTGVDQQGGYDLLRSPHYFQEF